MTSCWGSVCLLLFLGVVLASGSPCQLVNQNLKDSHEVIADVLKFKENEIGSHRPFNSVIKSINTSCQRKIHLMNATLDIYTRIFSSILQNNQHHDGARTTLLDQLQTDTERSQVTVVVASLQQKMEELKRHLSRLNHNREDVFSKLNKIDVDDPMVQRKALAQFREVYEAASLISSPRCGPIHPSSAE